jgi:serine/threonine protein kinase
LGEFELRERIGEGGFGEIHRAEQVGLQREAVVKILRSSFAGDETTQLRFLREARLASSLDHPYAAHIYAFGAEPDGVLWIAMELVRGTPLSEMLRAAPMPLRVFLPFFERLCEVVETAHEHGIVHRDVKPQNVMVITRAGALLPKLLDLGIAKDSAAEPSARGSRSSWDDQAFAAVKRLRASSPEFSDVPARGAGVNENETTPERPTATRARKVGPVSGDANAPVRPGVSPALTGVGQFMGSPAYMAPEQWVRADQVTRQCDIYALGVLAYEAIAGYRPFSGSFKELADQHLTAPVPPLPPNLPSALHEVLAGAMAKEPADRPPSAMQFAREFRRASGIVAESLELPRLERDVADVALRGYPQPLAEAVAELDGARGVYQALDAVGRLVRVAVRLLAVLALAGWQMRGGRQPLALAGIELLAALRKRRLSEEEWLELARAFTAPFAERADDHPVPEVVRLLTKSGSRSLPAETLAALLRRQAERSSAMLLTERAAADELAAVLPVRPSFAAS